MIFFVVLIKAAFIGHFDCWQTRWSWSNALWCCFMFIIFLICCCFSISCSNCKHLWRHVRCSSHCVCECNWLLLEVKNVLCTAETIADHHKSAMYIRKYVWTGGRATRYISTCTHSSRPKTVCLRRKCFSHNIDNVWVDGKVQFACDDDVRPACRCLHFV